MPGRFPLVRRLALALVILVCALWGATSLTYPFGWDQAIIASVGDVVLQGGMPYRDGWDMKGPLAYLWFAAAQWLFGRGQAGIRVFDLVLLITASLTLASAAARVIRPSVGPWAAAALVLCYGSMNYFFTAQADGAVALLLTLAFAPILRPVPRVRHVIVAGFAIGLAALVKPVFLAFLLVPMLTIVQRREGRPVSELALTLAAAALPIALTLSWFAARGALSDLIDVHIRFAAGYSEVFELAVRDRLRGLARYFMHLPEAPAAVLIAFGGVALWRRAQPIARLTIVWLLTALAIVVLQRKFFVYQWSVMFPPAILLVVAGIDDLVATTDRPRRLNRGAILGVALAAVMLLSLAVGPIRDIVNLGRYVAGLDSHDTYYARFGHEGDAFSAADQMAAAEYLRAHTTGADRIAIFGYDAPALYLSSRRNATRFSFPLPLVGWRSSQQVREQYQREFMDALRDPPAYFIVGLLFPTRAQAFTAFPEFGPWLEQGYAKERSFGAVDLYRRR